MGLPSANYSWSGGWVCCGFGLGFKEEMGLEGRVEGTSTPIAMRVSYRAMVASSNRQNLSHHFPTISPSLKLPTGASSSSGVGAVAMSGVVASSSLNDV